MADEKRRLIYELLVEARGGKDVGKELGEAKDAFSAFESVAKKGLAVLAAGFTLKGIADALDELTKFNQQLAVLGVTGDEASKSLHAVQDIAFTTGQAMQGVGEVFKQAIELQQQLGGSTEDAARTANAFVRAAVAEGKSAAQAAQQLETLQFALDKGGIKTKEFTSLLKENETFQQAAQAALGKTTTELVKMAEEGRLTNVELVRIIQAFEEMATQKEVAVTFDGIVESLKTLGKTLVQAFAEASGFNAVIGESGNTGLQVFMQNARGIVIELAALVRLVSNFAQQMVNVATLFANILLNPLNIVQHWQQYTRAVTQDMQDMGEAWADLQRGFVMGTTSDPELSPANNAAKQAEQAARNARALAMAEETATRAAFADYAAKVKEANDKIAKEREKEQEKAAADAQRAAEKQRKEDFARMMREAEENVALREQEAERMKAINDYLEESRVEAARTAGDLIVEQWQETSDAFDKMMEEQMRVVNAVQDELQYAFADLFSGGIRNAREFFRTVLQGLARVFAQQAAMQAASSLRGFLGLIFGAMTGAGGGFAGAAAAAGVSAKGNVFDRGALVPFASGGVVTRPTVFPMANGMGLMGEAGPEGIMPLKRMRDGKLGVAASAPTVILNNHSGTQLTARVSGDGDRLSIVLEAARVGARAAVSEVNRSLRSGYGATAQSMQRTYGLRRAF